MRTENSFSITSNGLKPLGYFPSFYSNKSSFFQTIKINRILPVICIGFVLLFISFFPYIVFGQSTGDYRTNAVSLNWNAASNWQRWNGSTWVTNPSQGYPGQNTGTGTVTILNGHSVALNVSPAQNIGSLIIGGGTSGSLTIGNNNTNRILKVTGN